MSTRTTGPAENGSMRAILAVEAGGSVELRTESMPVPDAGDGLLVAVEVAGVAYPDVLQLSGQYQVNRSFPFVPGSEAVGTVVSAPPGHEHLLGTRVIAVTPSGAWQERVAVPVDAAFAVPGQLSAAQASLMLLNHVAAYFGLVTRGGAKPGETLVVHGAAGGIGGAAVQVGSALGLRTIAVTSTPAKAEHARALGAHHTVAADNWKLAVEDIAGPAGVDLLFDPVTGDRFDDGLRVLAPGGRLLVIGFLGGAIPQVKINRLLLRNISLVGVAAGAWMQRHPHQLAELWSGLTALVEKGAIKPPEPDSAFPLERAADAVASLSERRAVGKVVLMV
ncbi:NADPH:quinone oxidoreductase family protein [Amycolatopsis sp.]|uniref:NADPH:quinone oxidoreductase family protein n=1 Tax=Amycolatopsis sp. TaxID=37632 RepID=UPI002DF8AD94|nr:NADPH:quinone oxidoreductase family protein [Amycolatopsis sp.]